MLRTEGREILATLRGLEDEVAELQGKGEKLKQGDLSLDDLEKKLRKNLRVRTQEKAGSADGADE